jgi:hypothetical protein
MIGSKVEKSFDVEALNAGDGFLTLPIRFDHKMLVSVLVEGNHVTVLH